MGSTSVGRHGRNRAIRFGVNYVPSKKWYYCWNDWNRDAIAADFDAITAMGADHLRVQLIWPWFQPNPNYVSEAHLARLRELISLADERMLDVQVCALTGWLSGFTFLPPRVSGNDVFLSEAVRAQSLTFFDEILGAIGDLENFFGFDLGNEINCLACDITPEQGDNWGKAMTAELRKRERMAGRWLVNGVDHGPWFNGRVFTLEHLCTDYDAVCLHAWPKFTSCLKSGGLAAPPAKSLSAFLSLLAKHSINRVAHPNQPPVWIQEFGASEFCGTAAEHEDYMRTSVRRAIQAGATWFTWWCSHDVDRRFSFDPFEYSLGLLTTGNERKPSGHVFKAIIDEYAPSGTNGDFFDFAIPGWTNDFRPQITQTLPPKEWLEQNRFTTTWELFEACLPLFR